MKQRLQKAHICGRACLAPQKRGAYKNGERSLSNGIPAALGDSADPDTDVICVDGKPPC